MNNKPQTLKTYIVILRHASSPKATTLEAYKLRDALTMGYDFLLRSEMEPTTVDMTVIEVPKEPKP